MKRLLMSASILASALALCGQDRALAVRSGVEQPAAPESRVALVIGNSAYGGALLKNPSNDARSMQEALVTCKFEVTLLTDAGKKQMEEAISAFGQRLKDGAVGLFYFAGHGMQIQGENYLIPIGAVLGEEADIKYQGVNLGQILDRMDAAKNPLNILILDACRNNPFARSWHRGGGSQGLASVDAPSGTVVAFATKPGSTAADGNGEHGTYTDALLAELREPGLKLDDLFNKVGAEVIERSGRQQTPWLNSSPHRDFYFRPLATAVAAPTQAVLEATFWEGIQGSRDAREFEAYLQRFPTGDHAELAQLKVKAIRSAAAPVRVDNLEEPWKALQKDALETRDEYAQRIASLGPVKVGTALVRVENYDVETGRLVLPIQPDIWAKPYVRTSRKVILMERPQIRQLLASGGTATVMASFEIQDGRPQPGGLTISTPVGKFATVSPATGAEKNAQGLWELGIPLGSGQMRMVGIPSGTFTMGTNDSADEALKHSRPAHEVTLTREFWIGKYDVTQAQWMAVMGTNPSRQYEPDLPVENVSWTDCQQFIARLNGKGHGTFRLPTEAEWEYACRAGTTGETYGPVDAIAWHQGNSGYTIHPVGQKEANAFGLFDMDGNVWQWCQDWYGDYAPAAATDPEGPASGSVRVYRGGSCLQPAGQIRSTSRAGANPDGPSAYFGLRLVKTFP